MVKKSVLLAVLFLFNFILLSCVDVHAGMISGTVVTRDKTDELIPVPNAYVKLFVRYAEEWKFFDDRWTAKEADFTFGFPSPAMPEPKEYLLEADADGYHMGRVFPIIFDGINDVTQDIILPLSPVNLSAGALIWETNHLVITVTVWNQTEEWQSALLYGLVQSPAITKPWTSFQTGAHVMTIPPRKWEEKKLEILFPPDGANGYQPGIPDGFNVCLWIYLSAPDNRFIIHDAHFACIVKNF